MFPWKATVGIRYGEDAGDPGGVREHGTDGDGRVEGPGRSTAVLIESIEYANRDGYAQGRQMLRWKSDPLVVLRARESRVHGEAAGQSARPGRGNISSTFRGRIR